MSKTIRREAKNNIFCPIGDSRRDKKFYSILFAMPEAKKQFIPYHRTVAMAQNKLIYPFLHARQRKKFYSIQSG